MKWSEPVAGAVDTKRDVHMFGYFIPGWGDVEQQSHDFYKQGSS